MGFSRQEYWSGLPFPPPVDNVLPELSTMTYPSWMALQSMAHSFLELREPLCCDRAVIHEEDEPPGRKVSNMLLGKNREAAPERMTRLGQSGKDTLLYLVMQVKSDAVKNNTS